MVTKVVRPAQERTAFTRTRDYTPPANHLGYAEDDEQPQERETAAPVAWVEGERPLLDDSEAETPWEADAEAREVEPERIEEAPAPAKKSRAKAAPKAKAQPAAAIAQPAKRGPGRPRLSEEEKAARALARKEAKQALKIDPTIAEAARAKPKEKRATNNDGTPNKRGRRTKAEAPESWAFLEKREPRTAINIRLKTAVIEWFKQAGPGYQTRISEALDAFIESLSTSAATA